MFKNALNKSIAILALAGFMLVWPFHLFGITISNSNNSLFTQQIDTDSIDVVAETAYNLYYGGDLEKALELTESVLRVCENKGDLNGVVQMINVQGNLHRLAGNSKKALNLFHLSLEHFRALSNKNGEASTLNQIGTIYRVQGNYPGALEYSFASLNIFTQIKDTSGISKALNNIGIVYFYQKNYDKALDYYQQSLKLDQLNKDEYGISISYINIGEVHKLKGNYKHALDYFLRALVLAKKHEELDEDKDGVGVLYNEIGSIYLELGDLQLSQTYLNNALQIFKEIGNRQRMVECYLHLGDLAQKKGDVNGAFTSYTTALNHANTINLLEFIAQANLRLSKIYEEKNNSAKAFGHFKQYIQARDSLFNEDNTKRTVQAEMLYQFDKQMQESKIQQAKKDAIAHEITRRQSLLRNFMAIVLVMLVVVVVVIYNAFKSKHRANEQLRAQQQQILEKNEELLQQQEEILSQRDEIEQKNRILVETQQVVEAKNDRIISSIEYAQTIQQAILPNEEQLQQYFPEHMVIFLPKDIVSGDFYWFSSFDNLLFAAVIDCTGHGVPGSFMSLIGNTMLNQIINEWQTRDPALILELMHIQVRKALKQESSSSKAHASMDICLISIDPKNKKGTFAGASRPLYLIQNGVLKKISGDPRSVGGYQREAKRYFTNHEINLSKPTQLYLTTDGYIDQMNDDLKKFGPQKLSKLLLDISSMPMDQQKETLVATLMEHKQKSEQIDDICMLGLKI